MQDSARALAKAGLVAATAVLGLAMFANAMTKPLGRDEHMYCTGGVLLAQGQMIYRDFSYVAQLPYHPLILAALFKTLGTTHYLLTGRIVSLICDLVVLLCIIDIYRRVLGRSYMAGALVGLAGGIIYVFNPIVDYANGYAWNNDVVVMCVGLSFWLFVAGGNKGPWRYWRIGLVGILVSLATFMRMTTVVIQGIFLVVVLWKEAEPGKGRLKAALVFLAVTGIVSLWPIYAFVCAPRAFFVDVFRIHLLNSQRLHKIGMFFEKPRLLSDCLGTYGYLSLIVTAIGLGVLVMLIRRRIVGSELRGFLLAITLAVAFLGIALVLPETWIQHLAPPVPFIIISMAYPLKYFAQVGAKYKMAGIFLVVLCALISVVSYPLVWMRIPQAFARQNWVPILLHEVSQDIVERAGRNGQILTLTPLLALEGGGQIYRELSAGVFAYGVSDFMSAEDLAVSHTAGPKELARLIRTCPPAAVVVGLEWRSLEEALIRTAVGPGWYSKSYGDTGVVAYFPP